MTYKLNALLAFAIAALALTSCDSVSVVPEPIPDPEPEMIAMSLRDSSGTSAIYVYDVNGETPPRLVHGPVVGSLSSAFSTGRDTLFVFEHGYPTLHPYSVRGDSVDVLPSISAGSFLTQSYLQAIPFRSATALIENYQGIGPAQYSIWSFDSGFSRVHHGSGRVITAFGPDSLLVRRVQGITPELAVADVVSGNSRLLSTATTWGQYQGQGAQPLYDGDYDEESDLLVLNTAEGGLLVLTRAGIQISQIEPEGLIITPGIWGPGSRVIYVDRNSQEGTDTVFLLDIQANDTQQVLSSLDVPTTARIEQVSY